LFCSTLCRGITGPEDGTLARSESARTIHCSDGAFSHARAARAKCKAGMPHDCLDHAG
jgi:hypothetical protein